MPEPFGGCGSLLLAGLGEGAVIVGVTVPDQVEKSAGHHGPFRSRG
jgi:hypothetical protein